jgi:predicted nucleotidyltransferase
MAIKTEHNGAKNGGGYWGLRVAAKAVSRRLRRRKARKDIIERLKDQEAKGLVYASVRNHGDR